MKQLFVLRSKCFQLRQTVNRKYCSDAYHTGGHAMEPRTRSFGYTVGTIEQFIACVLSYTLTISKKLNIFPINRQTTCQQIN